MLELVLVRHGMTAANTKKRYIGTTDEPLCEEGISKLKDRVYPPCEGVFASPMLRCRQTASIIYPNRKIRIYDDLRECDFGEFENKNYQELQDNPHYQRWIDSGGTLPFPDGESREQFRKRSLLGFEQVMETVLRERLSSASLIVHGGTIMSVLETWACPAGDYYSWHVDNGCGYRIQVNKHDWQRGSRQLLIKEKF